MKKTFVYINAGNITPIKELMEEKVQKGDEVKVIEISICSQPGIDVKGKIVIPCTLQEMKVPATIYEKLYELIKPGERVYVEPSGLDNNLALVMYSVLIARSMQ